MLKFAAVCCAVALLGCGGSDDEPASSGAEKGSAPELPAEEDFEEAGAERLNVSVDFLSAGGGAVWGNWEATMVRIDPDSGEQTDVIRVPQQPCGSNEFAYGAVWTATCSQGGLARIDARSLELTHVPLDTTNFYNGSAMMGVGEGAVWTIGDGKGCEACVLLGVDPGSLEVAHEVELEEGAGSIAVGLGSVWVVNPEQGTVVTVDPQSDEVVSEVSVEGSPQYVAIDESSAWVFNQLDGTVVQFGAEGEAVAVIAADMAGAGGSITTGEGSVWVSGALTLLEEIDAETGEVLARYGPRSGGGDVIITNGAVWVSRIQEDFEDILRLDLSGD